MIDITTTRLVATENHPPRVIFALLGFIGLLCALLAGYSMSSTKTRNWFYVLLISVTTSVTMYVIFDLEIRASASFASIRRIRSSSAC